MSSCPVCKSEQTKLITDFEPYLNKSWHFPVYDCSDCLTRFALRDDDTQYHKVLHERHKESSYRSHYTMADRVAKFIENDQIDECEKVLKKDSFMYGRLLDLFQENKKANPKILELGCSTGYFTAFLNSKGYDAYGSDIVTSAISFAKKNFTQIADRFSSDPVGSNFDIVFHKGVISCVSDPVEFIDYCHSLLNPGGTLIFNASNVKSTRKLKETWAGTPPPDVIFLFHEQSIVHLLKANMWSFGIEKHYNYFHIYKKNISLLKRKMYNRYPRVLGEPVQVKKNFIVSIYVYMASTFCRLLVRLKLFKKFDEDFGIIINATKRK